MYSLEFHQVLKKYNSGESGKRIRFYLKKILKNAKFISKLFQYQAELNDLPLPTSCQFESK